MKKYYLHLISTLLGALAGYVLVHPYTMFIYVWAHEHQKGVDVLSLSTIFKAALTAFQPIMLPMSLSFVLFGALVGLLVGALVDKRRRLFEIEMEAEKRRVAVDTLHQLMVTLSHYLLNANTIIGGMVRHCLRQKPDREVSQSVYVIEEQAKKIDAVIGALQRITTIKAAEYVAGEAVLIDIGREIEEKLRKASGSRDHEER